MNSVSDCAVLCVTVTRATVDPYCSRAQECSQLQPGAGAVLHETNTVFSPPRFRVVDRLPDRGETPVTGGEELVGHACPKRMQFGPCGGVKPDGQCEMRSGPCAFDDVVPWPGGIKQLPAVPAPLILTDFSCAPFDSADVAAIANIFA